MKRAIWLMAAALPLAAQPKLLINAQVQTHSAAAGLESQFKALLAAQPPPAWIGYSVPSVRTYNLGCDYVRDGFTQPGVVHLEPPDHAVILFRVEANTLNRIRTLSPDCEIDAGGVPVHWLTDVQPAQSVALLVSLMPERDRVGDSPVNAIAQHADPAADQALERFLAPNQIPNPAARPRRIGRAAQLAPQPAGEDRSPAVHPCQQDRQHQGFERHGAIVRPWIGHRVPEPQQREAQRDAPRPVAQQRFKRRLAKQTDGVLQNGDGARILHCLCHDDCSMRASNPSIASPAPKKIVQAKRMPPSSMAAGASLRNPRRAGLGARAIDLRQAAHSRRTSCSVTHSRQKDRPHSGHRHTASRAS